MRRAPLALAALLLCTAHGRSASAHEGQWMPEQLADLDARALRRLGLRLPMRALWGRDGGLLRAAVNYTGCSAAFVSSDGLIATNHHCAHPALQAASTVDRDLLRDGFVARTRAEELPSRGKGTVSIVRRIVDLTAELRAAADGAPDDLARQRAVEAARKRRIVECEAASPGVRCEIAEFYLGAQFRLFETIELRDVRLVYAPPSSIGEYGGETDNWTWPRHTGDFALLRAYVGPDGAPADHAPGNVPYRPAVHLATSAEGVAPGEFVAVLGYPGRTRRYLPASEVDRLLEQVYPATAATLGEWLAILEAEGAKDPAVALKVAATRKALANREKNARGMVEGLSRLGLAARKRAEEAALAARPGGAEAVAALAGVSRAAKDAFAAELLLLDLLPRGPGLLAVAVDLARRARESAKPDLEREPGYMDRNAGRLERDLLVRVQNAAPAVEARLLAALLGRLPPGAAPALDALRGPDAAATLARLEALTARTALLDPARVKAAFAERSTASLGADPLAALATALVPDLERLEAGRKAREGAGLRLGPGYVARLREVRPGPVYPDANGTLRFTYATVEGYRPRDGLLATPETTLSGALAKHTGADPFDLPAKVREAAPAARSSRFADRRLGDLRVAFLTSADTTGGNSGSPVVDGRGRLVGLNFDRVWENVAGDFGYSPERSRNIVVDVRYMLWLLELEGATGLLEELGVGAEPRRRRVSR